MNPIRNAIRKWRWRLQVDPKRAKRQLAASAAVLILVGVAVFTIWSKYGWILSAAAHSQSGTVVPSSINTEDFDGRYVLQVETSFASLLQELEQATGEEQRSQIQAVIDFQALYFDSLQIDGGVLRVGQVLVQEFSLIDAAIDGEVLTGKAIWHEDIHDPGDFAEIFLRLERRPGNLLAFSFDETSNIQTEALVYQRVLPGVEE